MATVPAGVEAEAVTVSCARPVKRPVMLQGWHDLASVHWRYPPEAVQALLPDGFRARMSIRRSGDEVTYTSRRRWPKSTAHSELTVRVGEPIDPAAVSDLEHFLTTRWALGTRFGRHLVWAEVDHPCWPLHRAELVRCHHDLVEVAGLVKPTGTPVVLWSPGVEVAIGRPRRV